MPIELIYLPTLLSLFVLFLCHLSPLGAIQVRLT